MCTVSKAHTMNAGSYTCCDQSKFTLTLTGSLICSPGAECDITITVSSDVVISGSTPSTPQILLPTINAPHTLSITSGGRIQILSQAIISAGVIQLVSTLNSSSIAGVTCSGDSSLNASGLGSNLPSRGTPLYPGAPITSASPPAGRGLGASHGGAGSTGFDATPTSLFEASKTYPTDPFNLPELLDNTLLSGSQGGKNNLSSYGGVNIPGNGGGIVWISTPASITSLGGGGKGCFLSADGAPGQDAGGGSGGSVIVDAFSIQIANGAKASAVGGGVIASNAAAACLGYVPCGLPAGGGIVYARSSTPAITPLSSWGLSGGGGWTDIIKGNQNGLCGGAGLLVDCQNNVNEDTDCDVVVSGVAACATPDLISTACKDFSSQPAGAVPNFKSACLAPPTTLSCGEEDCGAVTLSKGANLTLVPAVYSNRTITGTSSYISSMDSQPTLSARLGVSLTGVTITTPSDGIPRNYTVESTTSTLSWVASNMSLVGSLAVSSGLALNVTFNSVNIFAPFSYLSGPLCHTPTLDGALLLSAGTACEVPFGSPPICSLPQGALTFKGSMNAVSFGAYAYSDIIVQGGSVTTAGCASGVGPGNGTTFEVTSGSSAGFSAGGGAGHYGLGGDQSNGFATLGGGGIAYDTNPFVLFPPIPFGGSGGGGNMSVGGTWGIGGSGGGTIVLIGNGTIKNPGLLPMTLSASGTASVTGGLIAPQGVYPSGGGGSGGSVWVVFSSFNEVTDGPALQTLTLNAQGGAGGFTSPPGGANLCGGGGSGGNVIVAVPFKSAAPSITPKVIVSGGTSTSNCFSGKPGQAIYTRMPASQSFSNTPTSTSVSTSTATSTSTTSATATSTSSSSSTASGMTSSSASDSSSPSPSVSPSASVSTSAIPPTPSNSPTPSISLTPTTTISPSSTGTPSASPSPAPPQILGLKVPEFIAVSAATGSVVFLIAVWLIARAVCAPRVKTGMLIPSSSAGGSLWGGNAGGTDMGSIFDDPRERYVPPTGVV